MMKKPLVGISDNFGEAGFHNLKVQYVRAFADAGALPVIIPCTTDAELLGETVSRLDGVVLSGGGDIAYSKFGGEFSPYAGTPNEERDEFDLLLYRTAVGLCVPVFGICRGLQLINVAEGGDIYQDMEHELGIARERHSQTAPEWEGVHGVTFEAGTKTAQWLPQLHFRANSFHHQSVKTVGKGLIVTAKSDDGVIEGLESAEHDVVSVQYHPERMALEGSDQLKFLANWVEHLKG